MKYFRMTRSISITHVIKFSMKQTSGRLGLDSEPSSFHLAWSSCSGSRREWSRSVKTSAGMLVASTIAGNISRTPRFARRCSYSCAATFDSAAMRGEVLTFAGPNVNRYAVQTPLWAVCAGCKTDVRCVCVQCLNSFLLCPLLVTAHRPQRVHRAGGSPALLSGCAGTVELFDTR